VYDQDEQVAVTDKPQTNAQQHSNVDSPQQTVMTAVTPIDVHTPVELLFQRGVHAAQYSAYDSTGIPTHDANGQPLSKVCTYRTF
jgi:hypothetical protein